MSVCILNQNESTDDSEQDGRREKPDCARAEGELAVVLVSCDSYKDLWPLSTGMIDRFWPDCPYPKYLISNQPSSIPGFQSIAVGEDRGWSANLVAALEQVREEFVLLHLEDLILEEPVCQQRVDRLFAWFKSVNGNCLRMNPFPAPDRPFTSEVGIASKGVLYRASTVMTIWRKTVLCALLHPEESAWAFEIHGSERSDAFNGFYAAHTPTFSVVNAVLRGRWQRAAVRRVRRLGAEPDLKARGLLSRRAELKWQFLMIRYKILALLPARWRRTIRQSFC
jgi:hypothetical protein